MAKKDKNIIRKGYKFRMYPTDEQICLINKQFGACRFVYNWMVAKNSYAYKHLNTKEDIYMSDKDLSPQLTYLKTCEGYEWLNDVYSIPLGFSLINANTAFNNFFDRCKKGAAIKGYPKFKKKSDSNQSFQLHQGYKIDYNNGTIYLPKIGHVNVRFHQRPMEGTPKTMSISKVPSGKYYMSILVESPNEYPEEQPYTPQTTLGIDMGLKNFAAFSNGELIPNSHFKKDAEPRVKCLQRRLSHKKVGSANFKKAKLKLARLEEHISNQRSYFHHNLSARLVSENQAIIVENLNVAGMLKNPKLAKSIADVGWSTFINQLEYKSKLQGKHFEKAGRFFASSKLCSECGYKMPSMTLDIREWTCPICSTTHDRDINAAINLRNTAVQVG